MAPKQPNKRSTQRKMYLASSGLKTFATWQPCHLTSPQAVQNLSSLPVTGPYSPPPPHTHLLTDNEGVQVILPNITTPQFLREGQCKTTQPYECPIPKPVPAMGLTGVKAFWLLTLFSPLVLSQEILCILQIPLSYTMNREARSGELCSGVRKYTNCVTMSRNWFPISYPQGNPEGWKAPAV